LPLLILTRSLMHLERYITIRHLDAMAKVTLLTGSIVGLSYATELFTAWFNGSIYEKAMFYNRATGPYWLAFWTMVSCNALMPQLLWLRRLRTSAAGLFVLSIFVNLGMWLGRFVIIVTSLHRSYLPSSWVMYRPTFIEVGTLIGSFGLFFTCFLLFIRLLPMIAMWEIKAGADVRVEEARGHA